MCNLCNITVEPQAILNQTRAMVNRASNLEPGKVFPDYSAPIVCEGQDGRELRLSTIDRVLNCDREPEVDELSVF
jgi:hypothetical protein